MSGNGPYDLLSGIYRKQLDAFEEACLTPAQTQERRLSEILAAAADTAFGREYDFAKIDSIDAYRATVPINRYDELSTWIDREVDGESNVLTREDPQSFVRTSGTTGASKWIPITPALAREVANAQLVWMVHMLKENPKHPDGVPLTLVSRAPARSQTTEGGTPYGANTGRMRNTMPWYVKLRAVPHDDILAVDDEITRTYLVVLSAVGAEVGNLTTANATSVLKLIERIETWREPLQVALETGGLPENVYDDDGNAHPLRGDPVRPRRLRKRLRKRPRAAARLAALTESWTLSDLWPRLTTVNCWLGGAQPFFVERLRPRLGELPVRDPGYSASEGFFAIPLESNTAFGPLYVQGPFFEFVPADHEVTSDADTLLATDLVQGQEYHVIVTTSGGLYRYDMGDVVRVEGKHRETPRVAFVRKSRGVLNATGEKLTGSQATRAIGVVQRELGDCIRAFTLTLHMDMPPAVVLLAEAGDGVDVTDDVLASALDDALRAANEEYDAKRKSGRMDPVQVRWVQRGAFERMLARKTARGGPETQVKLPAVLPPDAIDEELNAEIL